MRRRVAPASALAVLIVAGGSCTEILDLDITFVAAGGGGAASAGGGAAGGAGGAAGTGGAGGAAGPGGDGGAGGAGGCGPVTVAEAGIESFGDASEDGWCRIEGLPGSSMGIEGGSLRLTSFDTDSIWYHESASDTSHGQLFYRQIADPSDFVVVARMTARDEFGGLPTIPFHSGSLMVRRPNPTPGQDESSVSITVGNMNTSGYGATWFSAEANLSHPILLVDLSDTIAALAICRFAGGFRFFAYDTSPPGWRPTVGASNTTASFPPGMGGNAALAAEPVVQVGLHASTYQTDAVVEVDVPWVGFFAVTTSCEAALPTDPTSID